MLRLGNTCGVRLPDQVVAEADTVQDLIDAILCENPPSNGTNAAAGTGATRRFVNRPLDSRALVLLLLFSVLPRLCRLR
jgi:hypothetical protein